AAEARVQGQHVGPLEQRLFARGARISRGGRLLQGGFSTPDQDIHSEPAAALRDQLPRWRRGRKCRASTRAADATACRAIRRASCVRLRAPRCGARDATINASASSAGATGELLLPVATAIPSSVQAAKSIILELRPTSAMSLSFGSLSSNGSG